MRTSLRTNGPARSLRSMAHRAFVIVAVAILCFTAGMPVPHAHAQDWSAFEDYPQITCIEALAVDMQGNVLFDRNASVSMPMASITKVMTALVALESGVPLDSVATVSKAAAEISGSVADYKEGESVTLLDLLRALLVHSGNDSAMVIADLVGGSQEGFVNLMNEKAVELGLTGTHFANPHGLDADGHYSCAYDLVAIAKRAWQYPLFRDIVGTRMIQLPINGISTTFYSTDELLGSYPGTRGVKTGFTYGAGNAFLGCTTRGGTTVFTVVLGTETSTARFQATAALLDWTFAHYPSVTLCEADAPVFGYHGTPDRFGWSRASTITVPASLRTSPFMPNDIRASLVHPVNVSSSIASSPLGTVNWYLDGELVCTRQVTASGDAQRTVSVGAFMKPLFYE